MHTLLIHQAFASYDQPGGTRHFELARHCVQQGHRFSIVASDLSYLTGQQATARQGLVTEQNLDGVQVLRTYTYPSLHRSFTWRVVSFLSFMFTSVVAALRAQSVDVVMGTSPPIFQAVSAWFIAAVRRRPFLLEIRDLWPEFAISLGVLKNPVLIKFSRWLESFLYARANHILVNSPAYRDYLIDKGIAPSKISLISNGVDTTMFDPLAHDEQIRQEWQLDNKFVVTYAGALGVANDITNILRAAALLRDKPHIHFLLVGDGKERANLEEFAAEHSLSNVTFTGTRPKSEMKNFLAASDACLATLQNIPMFRTTYPNKVFDYMAAGRATVLAIDGVIREVVEQARGGVYVTPGDPEALASAIEDLSLDREEARRMGTSAREYVTKHFDRRQQADDFARLLERIADDDRNNRRKTFYRKFGKRFLDITIASFVLVLLSPVLLLTALAVRLKLGAPVLFRQKRPGLYGAIFTLLKFRTMTNGRDENNKLLPDAQRLTSFGKFLRSASLDELPEVFNVLRGDMSLVGPRPLLVQYLERYTPEQARRHELKPGITGLAQISGRNALAWEEKFKLDVYYVNNCSFNLDAKILFETMAKVLKREGISAQDHVTAMEFQGTPQTKQ